MTDNNINKYNMIANKSTEKTFNETRHDCVMVYGKVGMHSEEMTCGDYLEMEYVIASLKKYCSTWVGRIFIVGSEPPERVKNDVIHVPCDNPYTHCKDANIIHKLRCACENIPDLSDDFIMISDDQIVTKESSWEDMKPRIVRRYNEWSEEKWAKNKKVSIWREWLYNTLRLFPRDKACFWEPHIWSPMNKYKFVEMCRTYNYEKIDCISQSMYYNFVGQEPIKNFDHCYMGNTIEAVNKWLGANILGTEDGPRHLAWTDVAFEEKRFRDLLDKIVGFNKDDGNINNIDSNNEDINNININNTLYSNYFKRKELRQCIQKCIKNKYLINGCNPLNM